MARTSGVAASGGGGGYLADPVSYAPSGGGNKTVSSVALTALDTTNLTTSFTTTGVGQGSTKVLVRLSCTYQPGGGGSNYFGVADHTSGDVYGHLWNGIYDAIATDGWLPVVIPILITGLTPVTAYQVDWVGYSLSGGMVLVKGFTAVTGSPIGGPAVMEVLAA